MDEGFLFAAVLSIVGVIILAGIIILLVCIRNEGKKKDAYRMRCTVKLTGTFVKDMQSRSTMSSDEYEVYTYNPVVRYEYDGQVYERECRNAPSGLWNQVERNTPVDVYINPENADEIYVPIPGTISRNHKRKSKIFLISFFAVWIAVVVICVIFSRFFK